MQCARHPKVETGLSCGRCDKPICPACGISGPVGMRCRDCADLRSSALYQVKPMQFAIGALVGLVSGIIAGFALCEASHMFLISILFIGPFIGNYIGNLILRVTGHKRGLKLEILSGVSVIGGALISQLFPGGWHGLLLHIQFNTIHFIIYIVAVVLTASAAVGRIRYM